MTSAASILPIVTSYQSHPTRATPPERLHTHQRRLHLLTLRPLSPPRSPPRSPTAMAASTTTVAEFADGSRVADRVARILATGDSPDPRWGAIYRSTAGTTNATYVASLFGSVFFIGRALLGLGRGVVSRTHCTLRAAVGQSRATLEDAGSTNGTYVDGQKVLPDEDVPLEDGAVLTFRKPPTDKEDGAPDRREMPRLVFRYCDLDSSLRTWAEAPRSRTAIVAARREWGSWVPRRVHFFRQRGGDVRGEVPKGRGGGGYCARARVCRWV